MTKTQAQGHNMFPEFFDEILKYSFQWLTCSKYIDKMFKVYLIIR